MGQLRTRVVVDLTATASRERQFLSHLPTAGDVSTAAPLLGKVTSHVPSVGGLGSDSGSSQSCWVVKGDKPCPAAGGLHPVQESRRCLWLSRRGQQGRFGLLLTATCPGEW